MCTCLILRNVSKEYPLVIGFNRDEKYERDSSQPRLIHGKNQVLCPIDEQTGGTWLGVNSKGLVGAVLDFGEKRNPASLSRARLLMDLLKNEDSACSALKYLQTISHHKYRRSTFVIADSGRGVVVKWHATQALVNLDRGLSIIEEMGLNLDSSHRCKFHRDLFRMAKSIRALSPQTNPIGWIMKGLREHVSTNSREWTTCCHSDLSGTVSSTIIALGAGGSRPRMLFASRSPCTSIFAEFKI